MIVTPTFISKQKDALKALLNQSNGVTELLYGGAAGGGKTDLGCSWIILMCLTYPDTRYLIGRAKLLALKQTTLKSFWDVCRRWGLKKGEHYWYNGQTNEIRFYTGSEVVLKDLFQYPSDVEFDSLGSLEITGAFIDEVNQVTEKAKNVVASRIRYKLDVNGLIPKLFMSCNPAKNWVYNSFYKPWIDGRLLPYRMFIQALARDNKFISVHYFDSLSKLDKVSVKRLRDGSWEYSDELSMFDMAAIQEAISRKRKVEGKRFFMAADIARLGKDKTVIGVVSNTLEIVYVVELSKQKTHQVAAAIVKIKEHFGIDECDIAIDSDGIGAGVVDQLEVLGVEDCVSIINNAKAEGGENYDNLKTQLYFVLSRMVNDGRLAFNCKLTDDQAEKVTQELQVMRREKVEQDGKVCMTSKAQVKQLIGRSPDYSDLLAYMMVFFIDEADDSYEAM